MNTLLHPTPSRVVRPSAVRRTAIAVTGFLACALPVVWTINLSRMLLLGELSEHRFHQLTGQGLLLCLLWLASVVPLVRAGWTGRRPSTANGVLHLTFVAVGSVCAVAAPGGGAPSLMVVIAVTGALLWLAIPVRPRVRDAIRVDPVLAPLALLGAALHTSYALDQVRLQNLATGHHAQNPHYFDMAWMVVTLAVIGVLGSLMPGVRRLAVWAGAGGAFTGAMGLLLGEALPWAGLALGAGVVTLAAAVFTGGLVKSPVTDRQAI